MPGLYDLGEDGEERRGLGEALHVPEPRIALSEIRLLRGRVPHPVSEFVQHITLRHMASWGCP